MDNAFSAVLQTIHDPLPPWKGDLFRGSFPYTLSDSYLSAWEVTFA